MQCQWEAAGAPDADGWRRVRCIRCGLVTAPTPHPFSMIHSRCANTLRSHNSQRQLPPFRRLANFTRAAIKHVLHGSPNCTQAEIDARLAVCHGCELYLPADDNPEVGVCTHKACGCKVTRETKFASKLAWRDQKCPLGKWG